MTAIGVSMCNEQKNAILMSYSAYSVQYCFKHFNIITTCLSGGWFLGWIACDVWLAIDYVASNASVLNLLIICIDRFSHQTPYVKVFNISKHRYLSVNYPIKYRNNRKLIHVKIAMASTWIISTVIWAPWILFWQFLTEDGRTGMTPKVKYSWF